MNNRHVPYLVKNILINHRCRGLDSIEPVETGFLQINVIRNVLRTPVADAFVTVSKLTISGYYKETGIGVFLDTNTSDETGSVPIFTLPVLTNENEMYNVSVIYSDFCPAYIFDVPIYPGITTTYNVYLHHYTSHDGVIDYHFILQPNIPGRETRPRIF